jgi:hypothetical protein
MFKDLQPPSFQPHQIVYLACDQSRLYTEVIEILVDRQLAWVRPLVLVPPTEILPLAASSPPRIYSGPSISFALPSISTLWPCWQP